MSLHELLMSKYEIRTIIFRISYDFCHKFLCMVFVFLMSLMLNHPLVLQKLADFKQSNSNEIPKDILVLLIAYKQAINIDCIYDIVFSYKASKQKKIECLQNIKTAMDLIFTYKTVYIVKDTSDLSKECKKLLKTLKSKYHRSVIRSTISQGDMKLLQKVFDAQNNETEIMILKLLDQMIERKEVCNPKFISELEKRIGNIVNLQKDSKEDNKITMNAQGNLSILSFVSRKEKCSYDTSVKRFKPIVQRSTIYVYDCTNPVYATLRKRSDLVNPTKKMFVKFTNECRPPVYRSRDVVVNVKDSTATLPNVDYDEDSTWEDDAEGEDIVSDSTEEEDCSDDSDEWIEDDVSEECTSKLVKKPILGLSNVKIRQTTDFDLFWHSLPLIRTDNPSQEILDKIVLELPLLFDNEERLKFVASRYMVKEKVIRQLLKTRE